MSKGKSSHEEVIVSASAIPVAGADGQPLRRIRVLPAGVVQLKDGRPSLKVDPKAVVVAAQAYWSPEEMPFDFDHQTLNTITKGGPGGQAPASGWVTPAKLTAEADGVYANDIDWTPEAAAAIVAKKYKYFSPLMGVKNGVVTGLYGGGLTNDPAIGGLTTIAASRFHPTKDPEMDLSALAASLKLPADATLDQILAAQSDQAARLTAASAALGVAADAPAEQFVAAGAALKTDPAKIAGTGEVIVPASVFADMQTRLGALEVDKVAAAVDAAITAGKIVPASRESMLTWARKDFGTFQSYVSTAPVIVAAGSLIKGEPARAVDATHGLAPHELAACSAMGMKPEDYAKGKEGRQ